MYQQSSNYSRSINTWNVTGSTQPVSSYYGVKASSFAAEESTCTADVSNFRFNDDPAPPATARTGGTSEGVSRNDESLKVMNKSIPKMALEKKLNEAMDGVSSLSLVEAQTVGKGLKGSKKAGKGKKGVAGKGKPRKKVEK